MVRKDMKKNMANNSKKGNKNNNKGKGNKQEETPILEIQDQKPEKLEVTINEQTEPKKEATVPRKVAIIVIVAVIALVLIAVYIYWWVDTKKEERLMNSYLLSSGTISLEIKNLDEVDQILSEAPSEYFILINFTGDEDAYNLEEGLKTIIDNYKLADCFYYLNITNLKEEDNYLARLNTAFNTDKITTTPIILYYQNGSLVDTVKRLDNNYINAGDFQHLLDIYDYEQE